MQRTCKVVTVALVALLLTVAKQAPTFGGEDFVFGPWHHELISREALKTQGFEPPAQIEIAWCADAVDAYLYSPLWWSQGGIPRLKVSMATSSELEKVHFDDNFSSDQIRRTWRRYLSGTMAGLVWAAERNDIAGARNLVGVSLHALQDFYSHSNWVDDKARRETTWFAYNKGKRDLLTIYAGAYEHAEQTGVKPHGKIVASPTILRQPLVKPIMELAASVYSPFHNSSLVQLYLKSLEAVPVQPNVLGVKVPENSFYVNPPGMNLDTLWVSNVGVRVRGITDMTGPNAFNTARRLAKQASEQWLGIIEDRMKKMGYGQFWTNVKKAKATNLKERQFEDYSRMPYQFISAGPYPPDVRTPEEEWYLRLQIRTGAETGSGTDADIWLEADGKRFLLDYLPRANPLVAYNDFEKGDHQVYTVGPFSKLPTGVRIFNDSADAPAVQRAMADSFIKSANGIADTVGNTLLSMVAGHADRIGNARLLFTAADLASVPANGRSFAIQINGGDSGNYRVDGKIERVGQSAGVGAQDWHSFRVTLTTLYCMREGRLDRLTDSDEPYLLALAVPFPGEVLKYKTDPFEDTDTGESSRIGYAFPTIRVPKAYGMISLPISLWEHDSEDPAVRTRQLDTFADEARKKAGPASRGVVDALGAIAGADWKLASMSIYAFNRGANLRSGTVFDMSVNEWIKGKQRMLYPLNTARVKARAPVQIQTLDVLQPVAKPVEKPVTPPTTGSRRYSGIYQMSLSAGKLLPDGRGIKFDVRLREESETFTILYEGPVVDHGSIRLTPGILFSGKLSVVSYGIVERLHATGDWTFSTTEAFDKQYQPSGLKFKGSFKLHDSSITDSETIPLKFRNYSTYSAPLVSISITVTKAPSLEALLQTPERRLFGELAKGF